MSVRAGACLSCLLVLGAAGAERRVVATFDHVARAHPAEIRPEDARRPQPDPGSQQASPVRQGEGASARPARADPWWGWVLLGRLHPMVVHFPIALLTIAAVIEGIHVARRRPVPSEAGTYCLAFGVAGGVASAVLGTLNAGHQTFATDATLVLGRHQVMGWMAVIAAAAALGAGHVARRSGGMRTIAAYLALVFATSAVVGATGHLGGELVYGSRYLTDVLPWTADAGQAPVVPASPAPGTPAPAAAPQEAAGDVAFSRDVAPIFEQSCVECHGPDKVRGRLRMDSVPALQKGGKNGALLKPGDPENSLVMRRVLGLDGEDRMPLDKDPLTDAQIDILRRWIAGGAVFDAAAPGGQ